MPRVAVFAVVGACLVPVLRRAIGGDLRGIALAIVAATLLDVAALYAGGAIAQAVPPLGYPLLVAAMLAREGKRDG